VDLSNHSFNFNQIKFSGVFLALVVVLGFQAQAQEMRFAEEELPTEAVIPRLDTPKAVLNRKLSYENRWQADLAMGWFLDEPFYSNRYLAVQGSRSWNEFSAIGLKYLSFGAGLSDYSKQFQNETVAPSPDFSRSKGPSNGFIAYYERRMMYGKVSLAKQWIVPSFLVWNAEAGILKYGARQLPLVGASIANRFFPTQHLGISLGLRAYVRQLVNPVSVTLRNSPAPPESDFKTATRLSTALDLSVSYLF
jgi:hypothetical protein